MDLGELNLLHCINNPFIREPFERAPSGRKLGPLVLHSDNLETDSQTSPSAVPTLYSICISKLLSTREPDHIPALLSKFDWNPEGGGESHALQSPLQLQQYLKHFSVEQCAKIIQVLRSASDARQARAYDQGLPETRSRVARRRIRKDRQERETCLHEDAATNPFYTPCPNPHHYTETYTPSGRKTTVSRWIYIHPPLEERIEYVDIGGEKGLPIKWQGCGLGCLDFLEVSEQDGFDADVLGEDDWSTEL